LTEFEQPERHHTMTDIPRSERFLTDAIDTLQPPSLAAAIIHDGTLQTVIEHGDATPVRRFRLGTLTHALTALTLDTLSLDWDAPAEHHLTSFRLDSPGTPTLRQLASHTAGLGTARTLVALFRHDAILPADKPLPPLAAHYNGVLKAIVPPGEKWCFSHDGYAVLGQVIADATGQPLTTGIQARLADPLGLDTLTLTPPPDAPPGHNKRGQPVKPYHTPLTGALAAWGSLDDLIALSGALLGGEYDHLLEPVYQLDPRLPGMACAFRVQTVAGRRFIWLNSEVPGYSAALWLAPASGTAVILLANKATDGVLGTVAEKLIYGLTDTEIPPAPATVPPAHLLAGYYAPSPGLLTNLDLWSAYGGGVSVRRRRSVWVISGQIDPSTTRQLHATQDPLAFRYRSNRGEPLVVFHPGAEGETIQRLSIGLYDLHRRPFTHSLGARLILFVFFALAVFIVLVFVIVSGSGA
jgi:CubicO group peptidase (beta-lactamase class C family)